MYLLIYLSLTVTTSIHLSFIFCLKLSRLILEPAHDILVLITCEQIPLIYTNAEVSNGARGLNFGLSLYLHPYFMDASSEGSGESGHMCRLI